VDLTSDANNCGVCGHSCCGGTCASGSCQEADLGLLPDVSDLTVDQNNIYAHSATAVYSKPRHGGATMMLVSDQTQIQDIMSDGARLFWSAQGYNIPGVGLCDGEPFGGWCDSGVFAVPTSGGTKTTYLQGFGSSYANLVYDANNIYWTNSNPGTSISWKVRVNPDAGFPPGTSYTGANMIRNYVSDGTYLYISYSSSSQPIKRVPVTSGGAATDFATSAAGTFAIGEVATDGVNLYYAIAHNTVASERGLWKKPLAGGAAVQLVASSTLSIYSVGEIATDGQYVYYMKTTSGGSPQLWRISVNGGTEFKLSNAATGNIQVVSECVYWLGSTIRAIASEP
jgi:hypothetical protein